MAAPDFRTDSVAAIVERVRTGQQSARDVTQIALDRIEATNEAVNAFVAIDAEGALAQADAVDAKVAAGEDPGPLAGVPMGVKDLEAVRGFTTSMGSALHQNDPKATEDSVHVARYRAAGAVLIGKTNTPEYGHKGATDNPAFGATANPWSLEHSPGGSSGGSAAALAAGMVPLATGSDGGGSIRIPASLVGLSGIKPETGRIPLPGRTLPGSGLLSVNGPMGRTAADSALALDVVAGPHPRDPLSSGSLGPSLAAAVATAEAPKQVIWAPTMGYAKVDAEVAASCRAAVEALAAAGTEIIELDHIFDKDPVDPWLVLWTVSRFKAQGHLMDTDDWDELSDSIKPQIVLGSKVSGVEFARAQDAVFALNRKLQDALDQAPMILTPTVAGQVPKLGRDGTIDGEENPGWVQMTYGINLTRNPAGSVCTGLNSSDLPIGLQIIGRHHDEASVLSTMAAFEQIIGFDQVPGL